MTNNDLAPQAVELSVVIPAYNEAERIGHSLKQIQTYFKGQDYEIVVVNDGSTDHTIQAVEQLKLPQLRLLSYEDNQGKGYAVRHGILNSHGRYVLLTDADLSTPIEFYSHLRKEIDEYPIVIGSRGMKESDVSNQILRVWLGKAGNRLIQLILPGIKDTQCGFKLFRTAEAKEIFEKQQLKGFGFDFEILFIAQHQNLGIKEVPVKWKNVVGSKVKPRHYLTTLLELMTVLRNHRRGLYS